MKSLVQCRCGHNVLGREILRTDLYERSSERDLVYVRFRCTRCRRLGQAFVPESEWDWSLLEEPRGELSGEDRDRLLDAEPISGVELLSFHSMLSDFDSHGSLSSALSLEELADPLAPAPSSPAPDSSTQPASKARRRGGDARRGPLRQSRKERGENRKETRKDVRGEARKSGRKENRKDDTGRPADANTNLNTQREPRDNDAPGEA